uniref:Uncharacterized protein n=1 Tax=Leersia perrieri TaxID=77586 RepID=A0A0D9W4D4_9ORYZ
MLGIENQGSSIPF